MLIPSLPSETVSVLPPDLFGLRVRVWLQSVGDLQGDPMLIPSSLGSSVLLWAVFAAFGSFFCF